MKRSMMQCYVKQSDEAVMVYQKAFDAQLGYHVKQENGTYYHAEVHIEQTILAISEYYDTTTPVTGSIMQFCLHYGAGNEEKIKHAYEVLQEGATILMPLQETDFSPLCGDLIDRFGVRWCLFV